MPFTGVVFIVSKGWGTVGNFRFDAYQQAFGMVLNSVVSDVLSSAFGSF